MKKLFLPTLVALLFSCSESPKVERISFSEKEELLNKNFHLKMNSFYEIDNAGILIFPLTESLYTKESTIGRNSYGRTYKTILDKSYWNIVFFNSNTNEYHLLTDKKVMILDTDYGNDIDISKPTKYIFYDVVNIDYNKDKLLNEDDPISLFVSDKFGKNFRQISPKNTSVKDWKYIETSNKVIMNTIKDSNKNNQFDDNDEVLTYEVVLDQAEKPREVFKPELKETLKKLYDRDWRKIKN
ncbi:MAG: hypothetical protein Q4A00_03390 [Flavobacteriaceae bacterium]|nr:hypothetical protein [Flavobacteriaceae bacterium]